MTCSTVTIVTEYSDRFDVPGGELAARLVSTEVRRPDIPRAALLDEQSFQEAERHLQDGVRHHAPHADRRCRVGRGSLHRSSRAGAGTRRRAGSRVRYLRQSGLRRSTKTPWNEAPVRNSATTAVSRSTRRHGCSRCRTTPRASHSVIINATATWRRTRFDLIPGNARAWEERDPHTQRLVSIHWYNQTFEGHRTIWMDGRPHPPAWAPHTWMGFSTGRFVGQALEVQTTHLKQGWLRRNGLPESDQATMVEVFRAPRRSPHAYLGNL